MTPARVLLLFLDGVGIGPSDATRNPFLQANLPVLLSLLGGQAPTLQQPGPRSERARAFAMDASLGVPGVPQSGTGQTAFLTGRNAPRIYGRHFGPWTPVRLQPLLSRENLLVKARSAGRAVIFANAYPRQYMAHTRRRRLPAAPLAAEAAGVFTRHTDALARGDAIASDIVNTGWRTRLGQVHVPDISAEAAGRNLARLTHRAELTFFAHYATDHAGHLGSMGAATGALELVDAFLGGILAELHDDTWLVAGSDHGNIEELTRGHTGNPSLGLLVGCGIHDLDDSMLPRAITDVPGLVLGLLGVER